MNNNIDKIPPSQPGDKIVPAPDSVTHYPGMQSASETIVLDATFVVKASLSARFPIRSVRVDNQSGIWLRLMPDLDYVPPWTLRRIFNVRGRGAVQLAHDIPPGGAADTGPAAGQTIRVTLYDRPQLEDPHGTSTLGAAGGFALQ